MIGPQIPVVENHVRNQSPKKEFALAQQILLLLILCLLLLQLQYLFKLLWKLHVTTTTKFQPLLPHQARQPRRMMITGNPSDGCRGSPSSPSKYQTTPLHASTTAIVRAGGVSRTETVCVANRCRARAARRHRSTASATVASDLVTSLTNSSLSLFPPSPPDQTMLLDSTT